jgi:predicted ATPase/class 3 adenylate cyclase
MARGLPSGTVTFCFTDIEGSTRLLARLGDEAYEAVLTQHRTLLRDAWTRHRGVEVRVEGDGCFVAFASAVDAITACLEGQLALERHTWPVGVDLRVRMGLHTGEVNLTQDDDYVGLAVHHAARVGAAANGRQVVVSEATAVAAGPLPEFAVLTDVGTYRLRDVEGKSRLFVLEHPDLPRDARPPRAPSTSVHNLPIIRTAFVGRSEEMKEVTKLLAIHPLVTITGTGGVGKTRLAIEAASVSTGAFPDGAWLVEFGAIADPGLVASRVISALGVSGDTADLTRGIVEYLHDRTLLLVLDNCEHLLDAVAELVDELLRSCPGLTVLTTSREPLRIRGEMTWRLPSLEAPADDTLALEDLADLGAVRLFCDRAQLADNTFVLDDSTATFVAQICRRLDGIPLALELAAARLRALSVEQLASSLDNRFSTLVSGFRTDLPRQQTLRATIDWSHELLDEEEKILFRRLSSFRGGARLVTIEAVCGDGIDIERTLSSLIDRSLVVPADDRYTMLETVHAYAAECLEASGETEAITALHRDHFLAATRHPDQSPGAREGIDWLGREIDNIRSAMSWRSDIEALELVTRLSAYWWSRGPMAEGVHWLQHALEANPEPSSMRAQALGHLVGLLGAMGQVDDALALIEEPLAWYRSEQRDRDIAETLFARTETRLLKGIHEPARADLDEAVALARKVGDDELVAKCSYALCYLATSDGRLADAEAHGMAVYDYYSGFPSVSNHVGAALTMLGRISLARGEYALACERFAKANEILEGLNELAGLFYSMWYLGMAEVPAGRLGDAREHLRTALGIAEDLGAMQATMIMASLAHTNYLAGETEDGRLELDQALALAGGDDSGFTEPYVRILRADIALDEHRYDDAAADAYAALVAYHAMPDRHGCITTMVRLAYAHHARGNHELGAQLLGAATTEAREIGFVLDPRDAPRIDEMGSLVDGAGERLSLDQAVALARP